MSRSLFVTLLGFTGLIILVTLVGLLLRPLLPVLILSAIIVIATWPLYQRVHSGLGGRANSAALAMTLLASIVLVVPAVVIGGLLVSEITAATDYLKELDAKDYKARLAELREQPRFALILERARSLVAAFNVDLQRTLVENGQRAVSFLLGALGGMFGKAAIVVALLPAVPLTLFFLYRDGERLSSLLWRAMPLAPPRRRAVRLRLENVISAVVIGITFAAVVQGLLGGIGYWFVGLPAPALLGALTAIASVMPVVGTTLVWAPAVLWLLVTGETTSGLILLAWSLGAVSASDNFLRPLLASDRTGLPFSLRMLGLIAGLMAFGLVGLVLGPLLFALCALVLEFRTMKGRDDLVIADGRTPLGNETATAAVVQRTTPEPDQPGT